jgi:hypothetical protein
VNPRESSLEVDPPRVSAGSVPGRSFSFADGVIGGAAAKVVATSAGQRASVKLVTIPADQLARFGFRQPLMFFIARFWGDEAGPVSIKAYDRDGRLIATTRAGSGGYCEGLLSGRLARAVAHVALDSRTRHAGARKGWTVIVRGAAEEERDLAVRDRLPVGDVHETLGEQPGEHRDVGAVEVGAQGAVRATALDEVLRRSADPIA